MISSRSLKSGGTKFKLEFRTLEWLHYYIVFPPLLRNEMPSSISNCSIILSEAFYRFKPLVSKLTAYWNHLGSFENYCCLAPTSRDRIGWGWGTGIFEASLVALMCSQAWEPLLPMGNSEGIVCISGCIFPSPVSPALLSLSSLIMITSLSRWRCHWRVF